MTDHALPGAAPKRTSTPSIKLLLTLAVAGVLAGLLIVTSYELTLPRIQANRAARLEAAILEVVPNSEKTKPLYLLGGKLAAELSAGTDARDVERIYVAYDSSGRRAGYAIPTREPGFADDIGLIFGYDAASGKVLGMKVLESKETPGLGDKIEKDAGFVASFRGARAPLSGVKSGETKKEGDIDVITGATISSRTVIRAINKGVSKWSSVIEAWEKGGGK